MNDDYLNFNTMKKESDSVQFAFERIDSCFEFSEMTIMRIITGRIQKKMVFHIETLVTDRKIINVKRENQTCQQ